MQVGRLIAMGIVAGVAACARGPEAPTALQAVPPVADDRARVVFIVPNDPFALVSAADVFINRRRIAEIEKGGVFYADVMPGVQHLSVNTELGKDTLIRVDPGATAYVRVSGGAGYMIGDIRLDPMPPEEGQRALHGKRMVRWPN